jgi:hypothetical protein
MSDYLDGFASKHTPALHRLAHEDMVDQYLFTFPNGYGASLLATNDNPLVYGKLELAVIEWEDVAGEFVWELCYATPVAHDVIGWLSGPTQVEDLLDQIAALPQREGPVNPGWPVPSGPDIEDEEEDDE